MQSKKGLMTTHNKPQTEQTKKADPNCNLCHGTGVTGGHDGLLEFECICLDEPMQNEPQLSAEMEEELQIVIGEALDKIDNQDGSSLISQGNFETAGFILPEVLHFLATALEEQRRSYIEQVEALPLIDSSGYSLLIDKDDVLALLNGTEA